MPTYCRDDIKLFATLSALLGKVQCKKKRQLRRTKEPLQWGLSGNSSLPLISWTLIRCQSGTSNAPVHFFEQHMKRRNRALANTWMRGIWMGGWRKSFYSFIISIIWPRTGKLRTLKYFHLIKNVFLTLYAQFKAHMAEGKCSCVRL